MISEQQLNNIKKQLNAGTLSLFTLSDSFPQEITEDQSLKGLAFLMKLLAKRINPFGNREKFIIENFAKFALIGYVNTANIKQLADNIRFYQPVYRVVAKTGIHFDYYYDFANLRITG